MDLCNRYNAQHLLTSVISGSDYKGSCEASFLANFFSKNFPRSHFQEVLKPFICFGSVIINFMSNSKLTNSKGRVTIIALMVRTYSSPNINRFLIGLATSLIQVQFLIRRCIIQEIHPADSYFCRFSYAGLCCGGEDLASING